MPSKVSEIVTSFGGGPAGEPTEADALRGLNLFVARGALPEPDEDEFYLSDLIGLRALSDRKSVV